MKGEPGEESGVDMDSKSSAFGPWRRRENGNEAQGRKSSHSVKDKMKSFHLLHR